MKAFAMCSGRPGRLDLPAFLCKIFNLHSTIYFMSWYASLAPHTIVCAVKATSAGDWAKGPWVAHTTRMCRCAVQAAHRREPGTGRDKCISMGAHSRGVWFRQHLHEQMTSDDLSDTSCCMTHVPITL